VSAPLLLILTDLPTSTRTPSNYYVCAHITLRVCVHPNLPSFIPRPCLLLLLLLFCFVLHKAAITKNQNISLTIERKKKLLLSTAHVQPLFTCSFSSCCYWEQKRKERRRRKRTMMTKRRKSEVLRLEPGFSKFRS